MLSSREVCHLEEEWNLKASYAMAELSTLRGLIFEDMILAVLQFDIQLCLLKSYDKRQEEAVEPIKVQRTKICYIVCKAYVKIWQIVAVCANRALNTSDRGSMIVQRHNGGSVI
ncbi:hypothetical protein RJ641_001735 [Dillenia turbinata]|uniref:Uncharacterized protein n=1 Tax=Dillenia turbinata TaxID=194707 RepID=A0AAN8VLV2_9MAGN